MTVSASPLNSVKLELGVILFIAVIVWLVVEKMVAETWGQLIWLGLYGIVSMCWLIWRTRRTYRQWTQGKHHETQ